MNVALIKQIISECEKDPLCVNMCLKKYWECIERCKKLVPLAKTSKEYEVKLYACVLDCDFDLSTCYDSYRAIKFKEIRPTVLIHI